MAYTSTRGRSAADINFENAVRYRQKQTEANLLGQDPGGSVAIAPGWDAFHGGLDRAEEDANANGMGFRADLSGIGQFDDPRAGGRLTSTDRAGIAGNIALGNLTDQSAVQQLKLKAVADQQRDAAIEDAKKSYADQVAASFLPPPRAHVQTETDAANGTPEAYTLRPAVAETDRERLLASLPPPARAAYEAQFAAQDLAERKQTEAERHDRGTEAAAMPFKAITDASGVPLTGDAALAQVPPSVAATVKGLLSGHTAAPTGTALKDPYWKAVIGLAQQVDPNFDAVNYNARATTRKDFTSGKAAGQINAINTAVGHLHDLSDQGSKLGNFGMNWMNSIYNALTPGGSERGVTLNNFNTLKEGVGTELMRVWRQVGAGSEKEIEDWKKTIGDAKSPEELRGAFSTIGGMLESKLDALDTQYKQGMGTDKVSAISPESRAKLDALEAGKPAAAGKAASGATVRLRAPSGQERDVPADQVEHYLAQGAKRVGA